MICTQSVGACPLIALKIARTAEHSRTGKAIPKGVISQFEAAEAKKDREIEKVRTAKSSRCVQGALPSLLLFETTRLSRPTLSQKPRIFPFGTRLRDDTSFISCPRLPVGAFEEHQLANDA